MSDHTKRGGTNKRTLGDEPLFFSRWYEELTKRGKVNLDILWLKDHALEESANLPAPEVIAADLEAAMGQFATSAEDFK